MKKLGFLFISLILLANIVAPAQGVMLTQGPPPADVAASRQETFKNVVLSADLIVSGNITGLRYEVVTVFPAKPARDTSGNATEGMWAYTDNNTTPGKFAYTIFTLTLDKVIKGDPTTKEVFIKAENRVAFDKGAGGC